MALFDFDEQIGTACERFDTATQDFQFVSLHIDFDERQSTRMVAADVVQASEFDVVGFTFEVAVFKRGETCGTAAVNHRNAQIRFALFGR